MPDPDENMLKMKEGGEWREGRQRGGCDVVWALLSVGVIMGIEGRYNEDILDLAQP